MNPSSVEAINATKNKYTEETINSLNSIIERLNKIQKDVDTAKFIGNSTNIMGTGIITVGIFLAPVICNASFGLAVAGGGLAIGGSVISGGASLFNIGFSISELKEAKELLERHTAYLPIIEDMFKDKDLYRELAQRVSSAAAGGKNLADIVKIVYDIANKTDDAMLSANVVTKIINGLPGTITNVSLILNIFGALYTVYDLFETGINISKGSKSDLAKKLEKIVKNIKAESNIQS